IRAVAASMVEAGLDGALVAISSVNGRIADPGQVAYSSTKAALYHLCRVAALDLGRYGIRVNGIGPGPTSTPMLRTLVETEGYVDEVKSVTPLGRLGTPELVAQSVANVIASDWITGQEIMVDGGSSLATARGAKRIAKMIEMERPR
ncbi:MAG TPA: SDR family oxidoreductase, partial [Aeromicrobium sp.]|nr:SDR family oxidoreductase [Aeromicrobium sp.]